MVHSLQANLREGKYGWAILDAVGLAYDITATAVPFLPAGVSAGVKTFRAGNTVGDSVKAGLDVARVTESTHQAAKALDAASTLPLEAAHQGRWLHARVASETADSMRYFDATYMAGGANRFSGVQPDMAGTGVWADVTTPGRWPSHLSSYQDFGIGIPILYECALGVVNYPRLLPWAGVTLTGLQYGAIDAFGGYSIGAGIGNYLK